MKFGIVCLCKLGQEPMCGTLVTIRNHLINSIRLSEPSGKADEARLLSVCVKLYCIPSTEQLRTAF